MIKYAEFLIALANQLDQEGKHELADIVDKDFEEFLELLESGELTTEEMFSGGQRNPRLPYSSRGSETPIFGV